MTHYSTEKETLLHPQRLPEKVNLTNPKTKLKSLHSASYKRSSQPVSYHPKLTHLVVGFVPLVKVSTLNLGLSDCWKYHAFLAQMVVEERSISKTNRGIE